MGSHWDAYRAEFRTSNAILFIIFWVDLLTHTPNRSFLAKEV